MIVWVHLNLAGHDSLCRASLFYGTERVSQSIDTIYCAPWIGNWNFFSGHIRFSGGVGVQLLY